MIGILVVVIVVGVIVYTFNAIVPLDPRFRVVVNALAGLLLFLYVLQAFGLISIPLRLR